MKKRACFPPAPQSHTIGDGATFYYLCKMLDLSSPSSAVESMSYDRVPWYNQKLLQDKFGEEKVNCVFYKSFIAGVIGHRLIPSRNVRDYRRPSYFMIDAQWVQRQK